MKYRCIINKISAAFLVVAMMVTLLPSFSTPVFAQETKATELPIEQFATVEQLKSFNTNDNDGEVKAAKVYFGNNNQQWWIAGSQQEQGLTLFAASPLAYTNFENDYPDKQYNPGWNCSYPNGAPSSVYSNHYGASLLRSVLKGLEASYFTSEEQKLMNNTTIYTNDIRNNSVYSTNDKLYLAYGNNITVGENTIDNLNNGLHVNANYLGSSGEFWIRNPHEEIPFFALFINGDKFVIDLSVDEHSGIVPAFELDLSTVLFASAVPAATYGGFLPSQNPITDGAFTLRYDASKYNQNLGAALVSYDKTNVKLSDVPNGTYLVVQNKEGATVNQIATQNEVNASDLNLSSFENCKVWLETTDKENRMTYATLAIELGIAEVDGVQFKTLQDAIDNCPENGVVKLLDNVTVTGAMISKKCTLDLNNYTITVDNPESTGIIVNKALTIITGKEGNIISEYSAAISNNGTLKVEGKIDCQIRNTKDIIDGNFGGEIFNSGNIIGGSFTNVKNVNNGTIKGGFFKEKPVNGIADGFVLLETNNTELPYRVLDKAFAATLNITIGNNLTLESSKLQQTIEKNTEIQPITIIVKDGYYLKDKYVSDLQAKGLSVTRENNKFTISGTLNDNLTITIDATKKADGNSVVGKPTVADIAYKEGLTLNDIKLPEGWVWANPDTRLSAGAYAYSAKFDTTNFENTTDFSDVEGYDPNSSLVVREIKVNIKKGNSSDIVVPEINEKTDIENLEIKIGDVVLVEGKDYTVTKKQDGDTVSVVIEFVGNYTGKITKTYKVTLNTNSSNNGNTNNSVTNSPSYDNGGPFTTDECGSVYDRWGNLMWKAPSCRAQVNDGYSIVNTGDR